MRSALLLFTLGPLSIAPVSEAARKTISGQEKIGAERRQRDTASRRAYQRAFQQMVVATVWHPRYFGTDRVEHHRFWADSCRPLIRGRSSSTRGARADRDERDHTGVFRCFGDRPCLLPAALREFGARFWRGSRLRQALAALVELVIGVKAERRSLESVAAPLTAIRQETGATSA